MWANYAVSNPQRQGVFEQKTAESLYKISKFITWPSYAMNHGSIRFCIQATTITTKAKQFLNEHKLHQRHIKVVPFSSTQNLDNCHLIYSTLDTPGFYHQLQAISKENAILTVSSNINHFKEGSMIYLGMNSTQLELRINKRLLESAYLAVDTSLLMLANEVVRGE